MNKNVRGARGVFIDCAKFSSFTIADWDNYAHLIKIRQLDASS